MSSRCVLLACVYSGALARSGQFFCSFPVRARRVTVRSSSAPRSRSHKKLTKKCSVRRSQQSPALALVWSRTSLFLFCYYCVIKRDDSAIQRCPVCGSDRRDLVSATDGVSPFPVTTPPDLSGFCSAKSHYCAKESQAYMKCSDANGRTIINRSGDYCTVKT